MQGFLTSFTVTMNRRRRTSGHIFQGRFKAQLVEDELYRSRLSRYIHLKRSFSLDEVGDIVAGIFEVTKADILARKSPHRVARRVFMYCACKYCSYGRSLTDIAKCFSVSISGLTRARDRVKADLPRDKELKSGLKKIESGLSQCGFGQ